jgi:EAL domain-containing protein (putative c-di-GMP-specific phosphodiesterase class I)
MIAPAEFVPIAERTGFIVPLGNWILREACLQLSAWQSGLPLSNELSISVNLSSVQFTHAALVDEIAEALRDSGLEPQRLVLELTEGLAMADPTAVTTLLMRLRAMGVRISVDDFGTGYSSLAYLRQFPIDTLKIDRSFVRGMVTNKDTAEIVASLIGMARQLGLHVVAEGIEHEDQLTQLRGLTCEAGQGDLFAKPLDADQAAELLKTGLAPTLQRQRSATASVSPDEPTPRLWHRGRLFISSNRVAVAVTALALLLSVGLVATLSGVRPALGSSQGSMANVKQQASVEASVTPPVPVLPPAPTASLENAAKARSSAMVPPASAAPLLTAISPSLPAAPPGLPVTTSLDVVHLHRLGSCRGRLDVSRDGVAFVSADDGDEAFTLKYTEFLHALADDTLTLKSATKTYRFKAADSGSEHAVQLRDLADRIGRSRR